MPRLRLPYLCLGVLATAGLLLAGCGQATTPAPSSSTSASPSAATPTASAPRSRSGPLTWHLPSIRFGPQSTGQLVLTGAARVTTPTGGGGREEQGTLRLHSSLPGAWPQIQETFAASGHGGTGTYVETMREPLSGALVRTTIHFTWRSSPAGGSLQGHASQSLLQKPPGAHVLLPGPGTTRLSYTRASGGILTFSLHGTGGSIGPVKMRMAGTGRAQTVLYCGSSGCSRSQGYLSGLLPPAAPLALLLASNP